MKYANPSHSEVVAALAPLLLEHDATQTTVEVSLDFINPAQPPQSQLELLDYHGITLLVSESQSLSAELGSLVARRRALAIAGEALRKQALLTLFERFSSATLTQFILFKGGALAYTAYRDPWLRPRSDADILIDQSDRHIADAVLTKLGYQKQFSVEGRYVSYQSSYTLDLAGGSHAHIDLHWRINNRQCLARTFSANELYQRGNTLGAMNNVSIPCTVDNLLIACLHRIGHHVTQERLIWLYDIYLLAQMLSDDEWATLVERAIEKQLCAIVNDGLQTVSNMFTRCAPEPVLLALSKVTGEPSASFVERNLPEWRYFMYDLWSMPSMMARFGLLRETLLPSPSYVRQQMATKSTVMAYLKRLIRGFKRVGKV